MGDPKSVFTHSACCDQDQRAALLHVCTVRTDLLIPMCGSQVDRIDSNRGLSVLGSHVSELCD